MDNTLIESRYLQACLLKLLPNPTLTTLPQWIK